MLRGYFCYTEAETKAAFEKERRARKRYYEKMDSYFSAEPCLSDKEKRAFKSMISKEYYKEG